MLVEIYGQPSNSPLYPCCGSIMRVYNARLFVAGIIEPFLDDISSNRLVTEVQWVS